jgi:hypothetical protein
LSPLSSCGHVVLRAYPRLTTLRSVSRRERDPGTARARCLTMKGEARLSMSSSVTSLTARCHNGRCHYDEGGRQSHPLRPIHTSSVTACPAYLNERDPRAIPCSTPNASSIPQPRRLISGSISSGSSNCCSHRVGDLQLDKRNVSITAARAVHRRCGQNATMSCRRHE